MTRYAGADACLLTYQQAIEDRKGQEGALRRTDLEDLIQLR